MFQDKIRSGVNEILGKGNFTSNDIIFHFGYDCVDIELRKNEISSDLIRDLEEYFGNDSTLIYVITVDGKGRIVLVYDIGIFILEVYGSWEVYEDRYGYVS